MIPDIIFRYAQGYDRLIYDLIFKKRPKDKSYFERRKTETTNSIKNLESELKDPLSKIVKKISQEFGVKWKTNCIIIYVLPDYHKKGKGNFGYSDPLTIPLNYWDKKSKRIPLKFSLINDILVHELCHIIQKPLDKTRYYDDLKDRGIKSTTVRYHLLTFAIQKKSVSKKDWEIMKKAFSKVRYYNESINLMEKYNEKNIINDAQKYLN